MGQSNVKSTANRGIASHLRSFPILVQKAGTSSSDRIQGQLLGGLDSKRLIIGNLKSSSLQVGDEVIVRMAAESEVLGFRSRVLEMCPISTPLYVLEMPEQVESINLRKSERLALHVPAEVQLRKAVLGAAEPQFYASTQKRIEDYQLIPGVIVNLSRGGCCISSKRPMDISHDVRVAFSLPGDKYLYRLEGKVLRHLPRESEEPVFVHGIQFERQNEALPYLNNLQQWITQNLPYSTHA